MLIIKVKNKGGIERALKEYKNKVYKTKMLEQIRNRQEHTKKSIKRREERLNAIYVQKKKGSED